MPRKAKLAVDGTRMRSRLPLTEKSNQTSSCDMCLILLTLLESYNVKAATKVSDMLVYLSHERTLEQEK
jgi:hypothetical protein